MLPAGLFHSARAAISAASTLVRTRAMRHNAARVYWFWGVSRPAGISSIGKTNLMSTGNPYEPSGVPPLGQGPNTGLAASKVSGPATALIVVGVINILLALFGLVNNAMSMAGGGAAQMEAQLNPEQMQQLEQQGFDPQMMTKMFQAGGAIGIVFNLIAAVAGVVIIMGGLKMKNLQSRGMAMTASILAMIPCISACCLIGLPIGIWSVVTLNDPNVRSAFTS
jgi:hypothetical protein